MGTKTRFAAIAAAALLSCESWAASSTSDAYGATVNLQANVTILGIGAAALARTPEVSGSGASSYGPFSQTVLGTQVGLLGTTVLNAGVLFAQTAHNSVTPLTTSRGGTENVAVNLQITPLLPLVGLTADSIEANAQVSGVCGALTASGNARLVGARVTALGGGLLNLPVDPPPNFTVGLNVLGITGVSLILNEQVVSGNATSRSITVNALHLDVSANVLLASVVGDIVIGSATAQRSCAAGDGPNLQGSKIATPNPATVGQPLQFTLSARNNGNQAASNVVLSDNLNPAFSIQSATAGAGGSCVVAGQLVTCSYPTLVPGATASATVNVIPTAAGNFNNALNTGFDGPDVDPGDDDPIIPITVQPATQIADVDVQLSANPNPATVGQELIVLISVRNSGPDATTINLSNQLTGSLNVVSVVASGGGVCTGTTNLGCSWIAVPAAGTQTATVRILPLTPGDIGSNASLTVPAGTSDPDPSDNSASLVVRANAAATSADFSVVKTASPNPATVGQPLTFTLAVTNAGPDAAGASVTDTLAAGLTYQSASASDGGGCSGTVTVVCTWASIPSGASRTATINVVPTVAGPLSNSAAVISTTGSTDPDPGDDVSTITIPVNPVATSADLSVVKTASPNPATVGLPLTFTLAVNNAGPDAAGASVTDTLAAGLTFQSASASNGGTCVGTSTVVCSWTSIPSGASRTATIITVPTQAGTVSNSAAITSTTGSTDPDSGDDTSTISIPVNPATTTSDLSVVKTATPNPATVGQPLTFTLAVNNAGPDASGASVTDTLAAGLTFQSAAASDGGSCSGTSTVVCSWTSIPSGGNRSATIVTVPTQAGPLSNSATITSTTGSGDPDSGDDTSTITIPVNPAVVRADFSMVKTANPNPVTVGQPLTYTLTVSNAGPDAAGASATDVLPAGVTLQSVNAGGGGSCSGTSTVTCTWASIAAGQSRAATIVVVPTQAGLLSNTAAITPTGGATDPDSTDDTSTIQVTVVPAIGNADLGLQMVASPNPVIVNSDLAYTLTVSNAGPDPASARVIDVLPGSMTLQSAVASDGGSCGGTTTVTCSWGAIPSGGSRVATITVRPTVAGSVSNAASVASTDGSADPNPGNNSASAQVQVNSNVLPPSADLSLQVIANPQPATVGQAFTLSLTVSNAGPDATSAILGDVLDGTFTVQAVNASDGGSCTATNALTCTWATIPAGGSVSALVSVVPTLAGNFSNTASVSAGVTDPNPANNSVTQNVLVNSQVVPTRIADLSTVVRALPALVTLGQTLVLQVEVSNAGPDAAAVNLSQTLDAGFTLIEISNPVGTCSGSTQISCSLASIPSGGSATMQLTVRAGRAGTITHLASAAPVSPVVDPDLTDNSGSVNVTVAASDTATNADLSLVKQAMPMDPVVGATVDYLLTIHNNGPDNAAGPIVVVDSLPSAVTAISVSAQSGGNCTLNANVVTCTWEGLGSGQSATASVLAIANEVGMVRNLAVLTHPNTDADPDNNSSELWVQVRPADGIASDGSQCRVTRKLTDHASPAFAATAEIRYGGADVIYADQTGINIGTYTESLLDESSKRALMSTTVSNSDLVAASRHGTKALVRSSNNLDGDGAPTGTSDLYLLDVETQLAVEMPEEIDSSLQVVLDGDADELFYLVAADANTVNLKMFTPATGEVRVLKSFAEGADQFGELKASFNGRELAFTAKVNPVGENADDSMEIFRFDADTGVITQVTASANGTQSLGGFDGAGDRLVWISNGQVLVNDRTDGTRQITNDPVAKRTALLTHNGRKVVYLAEAGGTSGSLEIVSANVDGTGAPKVLTRINQAGSGDRLLSHDGSAQTFLLASTRPLLDANPDGHEHLYVVDCDAIRSGAWYNPARSGHGFAIQRSQDGLAVLWYTYRPDGSPTWYIASGPRAGKSWQADLLDVRYNAVDGSRTFNTVGKLALNFDDSHNAVAQWTLNGITRFERIQFLEFANEAPVRDDTGIWFDPQNPGWGLSISQQGQTRFMLTYLYDKSGQPIWIEGQTENDAVSTPARLYFGPGLCPSCGESAPQPVSRVVGSFNVNVTDYADLTISTDFQQEGTQPIQWLRASRPFEPLTPLSP